MVCTTIDGTCVKIRRALERELPGDVTMTQSTVDPRMNVRDLVRQIGAKEQLNPYQIAGIGAVIKGSLPSLDDVMTLTAEDLGRVLMILDRTGEEAAGYLVDVSREDARLTLHPKFSRESLEKVAHLTGFRGRQQAIRENLVPVLEDIPNWLDLVRVLSRYGLDRDDEALGPDLPHVMEIVLSYLCAAISQPFDSQASSEGEYALSRLLESILKSASDSALPLYLPFVERGLCFLKTVYSRPINSLDRRISEISAIRLALSKRGATKLAGLGRLVDLMEAQAILTALNEIHHCPQELLLKLEHALQSRDFPNRERFASLVMDKIKLQSEEEIGRRKQACSDILEGKSASEGDGLSEGVAFIRGIGERWTEILKTTVDMIDTIPANVQGAFAEILVSQILEIDKPEVKELLIQGVCTIVVRLENFQKQASKELVDIFAELFLDRIYSSTDTSEIVSSLKAIESLGVTLGRSGYFLMAQELLDHILQRPLIPPARGRYTIEDDDTGEPLVLAEEAGANTAHAEHVKSLLAIVASNPRIMHRLIPYLVVQLEIGGTKLCDEDLIQYWISRLLRSNSSITHFLVRTLIKAIPYSFKDIGPLESLRLTAAGLAKELADRGVKPVGNFLGKLRGDIHWRGSIENFYFAQGVTRYFATGDPQAISEWMPRESMPYLVMEKWCSPSEAADIRDLTNRIFSDAGIESTSKEGMMSLVSLDTARYADNPAWCEFARRMVLNVIELVKGLYRKYFVVTQSMSGADVTEDLKTLDDIISRRQTIKESMLVPDLKDPLPLPVTLTEGTADLAQEIDRIRHDQPGTPIVLRAKKAGHAYAQKATYLEERFEAFNDDLDLEAMQETLATSINNTHFDEVTFENLPLALVFIDHLVRGVAVNGHSSHYLRRTGRDLLLAGRLGLTFDKVRDLLRIIKKELDDVHASYRAWFEEPVDRLLSGIDMDMLPTKLRDLTTLKHVPDTDFFKNYLKTLYISDLQARDGNLRVLETFIDKVDMFMNQHLSESTRKVVPDPPEVSPIVPFYFPSREKISPCRIGLKASLLRYAQNTPPYFVITTDVKLKPVEEMVHDPDFRGGLARSVERLGATWGRRLGDIKNPGLFSVRSGARVSMPGMMTTITNVGINDEIAEALAAEVGEWFAYDCYRRFLQEFSQAAAGIEREEFQQIIDRRKAQFEVLRKAQMSGAQMKTLAFDYKKRAAEFAPELIELLDKGKFLDILIHCAVLVMHSFYGAPATKYRKAAKIDGDWGSPAIVQAMVYGNREMKSSGTGVISYNPFTLEFRGDFAQADQGTDVVDGKVPTIPVYDPWKRTETLASTLPDSWKELSSIMFKTAEQLHLDTRMEYTIENGRLFVLQIRKDRERKERIPSLASFGYRVIAQGTGVYGKIFRGIMVTDRNQIAPYRHINKAQSIIDAMNESLPVTEKLDGFIFVVNDPVPEEIMEEVFSLPVSTALVSRLGGRGAHAADIAMSLDKVYVGQVPQIEKFAGKPEWVKFNDLEVVVGSKMIIHGQTGEIALYGRI